MNCEKMITKTLEYINEHPFIITFFCAELFFVLVRNSEIITLVKKKEQRTDKEELLVNQGLSRSLLLEFFVFVPASAILFRISVFPFIYDWLINIKKDVTLWYGITGIVAYNFPFASLRRIVTVIALRTLNQYAEIVKKPSN